MVNYTDGFWKDSCQLIITHRDFLPLCPIILCGTQARLETAHDQRPQAHLETAHDPRLQRSDCFFPCLARFLSYVSPAGRGFFGLARVELPLADRPVLPFPAYIARKDQVEIEPIIFRSGSIYVVLGSSLGQFLTKTT